MDDVELTVIVPAFNEAETIAAVLAGVAVLPVTKQIIVVDDGSTDGTVEAIRAWEQADHLPTGAGVLIEVVRHDANLGKGAAIRTALKWARGRVTVIQDADREYDPSDLTRLAAPILEGKADVVYGSRYLNEENVLPWTANRLCVHLLNALVRLLFGPRITDEATCYKAFRTDVLRGLDLRCRRFEFCPEATAKVCRLGIPIHEVPIQYKPRTAAQGKKIGWRDGLEAIATLLRWRVASFRAVAVSVPTGQKRDEIRDRHGELGIELRSPASPSASSSPVSETHRRRALAVAFLLALHAILAGWMAYRNSPGMDETAHVVAGISYWQYGVFDLYKVNPPLVKLLAAAPLVVCRPETEWTLAGDLTSRPEYPTAERFLARNGERTYRYITLARWACIPLSLVGGWACYRWAGALYGKPAGIMALVLWCFSPNVLAWASCVTMDLGAAALGVLAGYSYWRWLTAPTRGRAVGAGIALGLAQLTKFTWIVLFILWPVLWLMWEWSGRKADRVGGRLHRLGHLAIIILLSVNVLNLGYLFEGSFRPLGAYTFVSRALGGDESPLDGGRGGNRFAGEWVGALPLPVPESYVGGIDRQKLEFERGMWSYLGGEWRHGGWWYYYLYAAMVKIPLGTWLLGVLALAATRWSTHRRRLFRGMDRKDEEIDGYWAGSRNELTLLLPAIVVLAFASSQTGFSHHFRYVLPCLPFCFVWIGKLARSVELRHWGLTAIAGLALAWSLGSSMWVYPYSLSYFNELAGGPMGGHRHLLDSNIDWGQDRLRLKEWHDSHPEARPLFVYVRGHTPRYDGLDYPTPPTGPGLKHVDDYSAGEVRYLGPKPGWYAVSVDHLHERHGGYSYFLEYFQPVARAGYSIYIYHITPDEANRVRRELGLPELRVAQ